MTRSTEGSEATTFGSSSASSIAPASAQVRRLASRTLSVYARGRAEVHTAAPGRDGSSGKAAALFPTESLSPCSFFYAANDDPRAALETRGVSHASIRASQLRFRDCASLLLPPRVSRLSAGHYGEITANRKFMPARRKSLIFSAESRDNVPQGGNDAWERLVKARDRRFGDDAKLAARITMHDFHARSPPRRDESR